MADKTIGELPGISSLDAGSLFVAEQSGQAVKVSGKQLTDFSNVETTAQVEQAKASAQEAKTAQAAAEAAILKGPIIQNGTWWVYNQTTGAYQDTGIKATGPQGIPGPTSSVNGISPDASGNISLTASNVNAYSKTETDTLLQNKAPAGYGLGATAKLLTSADDANDIWQSGWYRYDSSNIPQNGITLSYLHVMRVDGHSSGVFVQTVYGLTDNENYQICSVARRFKYGAKITPFEYENPPMILGVEYRTTERYLGKPVYVKAIDFGELPNNSAKAVAHGISNMDICFMLYGHDTANKRPIPTPCLSGNFDTQIGITATGSDVIINTSYDPGEDSAIVVMKYTKTTD